jgi:hypothetical protein
MRDSYSGALFGADSPGFKEGAGVLVSSLRFRFSSFFAFLAKSRWRFSKE